MIQLYPKGCAFIIVMHVGIWGIHASCSQPKQAWGFSFALRGAHQAVPSTALDSQQLRTQPVHHHHHAPHPHSARVSLQVHISLWGPKRMLVTWVTSDHSAPSVVDYGTAPGDLPRTATGTAESYSYVIYRWANAGLLQLPDTAQSVPPFVTVSHCFTLLSFRCRCTLSPIGVGSYSAAHAGPAVGYQAFCPWT